MVIQCIHDEVNSNAILEALNPWLYKTEEVVIPEEFKGLVECL